MSKSEFSFAFSLLPLAVAALSALPGVVRADDDAGDSAAVVQDETVVVTATRTARTVDESQAAVQVIGRAEIERSQANDVGELLRVLAGIDVARNGGPGQAASVFIRGAESNHTLVMIDGVKVNDATVGGAAWQNLDPALIERIEVVRGPRSSLYGSEAIGGVVQIFTRRAGAGVNQSGSLGVGTNNSVRADARVAGRGGRYRGSAAIAFQRTDGFQTLTSETLDRGYSNVTLNANFGVDLGWGDLAFDLWSSRGNSEYVDFFGAPLDQDFRNQVVAVTLSGRATEHWDSRLKLSFAEDRIDQTQSADKADTERLAADWQNDIALGDAQLLTLGAYLAQENVASLSFGSRVTEDRFIRALFGQDQIRLGDFGLTLSARYTDDEFFGDETTWNASAAYYFSERLNLWAAAGTGYRAPSFLDLFGFGGNPELDPETSNDYELGIRYRHASGNLASLSLFQNEIDNLIAFVDPDGFLGPIPGQNINIDKARIRGVELDYAYRYGPFSGRLTASLQDPEDRGSKDTLLRRARQSASATLDYDLGGWLLGARLLYVGGREDFGGAHLDAYRLADVNLTRRLNRAVTLGLRVENLMDENYETVSTYKSQGRAFYVNLRFAGR